VAGNSTDEKLRSRGFAGLSRSEQEECLTNMSLDLIGKIDEVQRILKKARVRCLSQDAKKSLTISGVSALTTAMAYHGFNYLGQLPYGFWTLIGQVALGMGGVVAAYTSLLYGHCGIGCLVDLIKYKE
jgi:hypothetical protein